MKKVAFFFVSIIFLFNGCKSADKKNGSQTEAFEQFINLFQMIQLPFESEKINNNSTEIPAEFNVFLNQQQNDVPAEAVGKLSLSNNSVGIIYRYVHEQEADTYLVTFDKTGKKISEINLESVRREFPYSAGYFSISEDSIITIATRFAQGEVSKYIELLSKYKLSQNGKIEAFDNKTITGINDFLLVWEKFVKEFNSKNINELEEFINPETGFFVISNPGVYVVPELMNNFSRFFDNYPYLTNLQPNSEFGDLPYFSCEENSWNYEGCYWNSARYNITATYDFLIEVELFTDLPEAYDIAVVVEKYCNIVVYDTNVSAGFYFGKVNDKWEIFCIDLIEPCGA